MQTRPLARADLITGIILVVFGLAVLAESIGMPRFEERHINPWTIPGLVPGMLGIVIAILGAVVALRSLLGGALRPRAQLSAEEAVETRAAIVRFSICAGLCLVYALALVGRAPFWIATGLFVFAFVAIFEWRTGDEAGPRLIKLAIAAALAIAAMLAIPYLFEHLFLVRLP
jgi:hypothetical protein